MLIGMGPRINISYCCRLHPVQETWGSQDSLYRGQIQKLLQCCQKPYQQIPLVITIQKKYSLTYLRSMYRFAVIEKVEGQIFGSTGSYM